MSNIPFSPRWITNSNDIRQDNSSTKSPVLRRGETVDDIILSVFSSCSKFHQVIFHLLRGGCGLEYDNRGQYLHNRKESIYQLCCDFKADPTCTEMRLQRLQEEYNDVNLTAKEAETRIWSEL